VATSSEPCLIEKKESELWYWGCTSRGDGLLHYKT